VKEQLELLNLIIAEANIDRGQIYPHGPYVCTSEETQRLDQLYASSLSFTNGLKTARAIMLGELTAESWAETKRDFGEWLGRG